MLRFLPLWVELFLLVFCLIDVIQSDQGSIRNLGKTWWIVLILLFPLVGGAAWLVAGRPLKRPRRDASWPSTKAAGHPEYERPRQVAPDDDPAFLAAMQRSTDEKEDLLRKWEDDLRRRERHLDQPRSNGTADDPPDDRREDPQTPPALP